MGNLKKISAVVVALAIVLTTLVPAFAATYTTVNGDKAIVLNKLDLYAGTSTSSFEPSLEDQLTRGQGAVLLAKLFNMDSAALALTDAEAAAVLKDFADAGKVPTYAKKRLAYLVKNNIMSGSLDTATNKLFINAEESLLGGQFATLVLKQMGFTVASWSEAVNQLAGVDGAKNIAAYETYATKALLRDQAVGIMHGSLTAKYADKTATIIEKLVAAKPQLKDIAVAYGLINAVTAKALDVDSVAALNSKIVEISLNTAATAADVAATKFAVKDSAGKAVNVVSSDISPWSTKSVIVTLGADTTSGTLYTLTAGDKTFNFGGKGADTARPSVTSVAATDANEVTVTFDEAVKLETLKVAISESYGTKAALAVNGMKYDGSNKIVLSVGDMKDATLYKYTITDVTDLAGNQLTDNKVESTFVGAAKSTSALKFADSDKVKANYCDEVAVKFNVNVDPATLVPANFTITEKYGTKAAVAVTAVRVAKKDDKNTLGAAIADDATGKQYAILTVDGTMKDATLYEIKFNNLKTLYGVAQSSTDTDYTTTFVGVKKPNTPVELNSLNVGATSNTTFTISFAQKMDKATAENIANYAMAEAYGSKAALAITKAELQSNGTDIKFTTSAMNAVLYKLTVSNLKDTYGNANKTADSANIVSVAGKTVAAKIDAISGITRVAPAGSTVSVNADTQIVVTFNGNVGSNATDVSLYTIDGGVGYPSKAVKVDGAGNENMVLLTIGKTTAGTSYKLTVKGLLNADGVTMGTDGASASFAGRGNEYTFPKMQAVLATDKQTIKVYFDRAVDSSDIKGATKIWNSNSSNVGSVNAGALKIKYAGQGDSAYVNIPANKAWKDPENANVLIIRTSVADTFKSSTTLGSQFVLDEPGSLCDKDNTTVTFANNNSDVAKPQINAVLANDKNTITVYFDQSVVINGNANAVFTVGTSEDTLTGTVALAAAAPVKVDDQTYKIQLSGALANATYYVRVADLSKITDKSGFYTLKPTKDNGNYAAVQFGGSTTDATGKVITDVSVMMTDKNTIKVYYPERMDAATVTNVNNYKIYKTSDGATAADSISVPTAVVYDADTNTATLYLSATTISGAANNTYYLGIKDTVSNEMGLKFIKNDKTTLGTIGSGILVSFAASTASDVKPTIKNVSVNLDDATKITVEFDEAVSTTQAATILTTGTADADNEIAINSAVWGAAAASANNLFAITNKTAGTTVAITSITKISNTKFEVVVGTAIDKANSYELTIGAANTIYNLGGTQIETATDKIQKYVFTATK
jgi:hypothetical protein